MVALEGRPDMEMLEPDNLLLRPQALLEEEPLLLAPAERAAAARTPGPTGILAILTDLRGCKEVEREGCWVYQACVTHAWVWGDKGVAFKQV